MLVTNKPRSGPSETLYLATLPVGNSLEVTVLIDEGCAFYTQFSFQRFGFIVNSTMYDPTVPSSLVKSYKTRETGSRKINDTHKT